MQGQFEQQYSLCSRSDAPGRKDRFLDDLTAKQLGEALGCEIEVIPTDGAGGCKAYLGELKPKPKRKKLHFSFGGR